MNSGTYGLPTSYDLGYDSAIPLAVRLSNSGIFAHSAPWSVADQGVRNVSDDCINMPPEKAQWFYDTFSYGDIVQVTGTSTQTRSRRRVRRLEHRLGPMARRKRHLLTGTSVKESRDELLRWLRCHRFRYPPEGR